MSATLDPLIMDLVAFVAVKPRPYDEVIDAWRTSCPRLTVWEDAIDRGLITRSRASLSSGPLSCTAAPAQQMRSAQKSRGQHDGQRRDGGDGRIDIKTQIV